MTNKIELVKAKTLSDHLKGLEPSQTLMKALRLGETKVVDGVTYIVKQTPSGKLDWRVLKGKTKTAEDLFDTDHFPDLTDLTDVKGLGGSTGAKLVKDKTGKEYVKKTGNSKAHVEEEYLANSIYKLMGVNVPNMKLYKGAKESVLLSDYMPDTTNVHNIMDDQTRDNIADNFVLDCLLANWDIYKNDNILNNNETGEFVRVDNGGALRFSAQGRPKGDHFADDVDELDSMAQHNPYFAENLKDKDIKKQIKKILVKGNDILELIEDEELKETMSNRLMDLKDYVSDAPKDPHRELRERDLSKAYRKAGHLMATTSDEGWTFLSEICKMRGFDEVPTVLDKKDFDKILKDDKDCIMVNRGISGYNGTSAAQFMKDFVDNEKCFYGTQAMYGAGIYGSVNRKKKNDKSDRDYNVAYEYARFQEEHVLDLIIPSDAKVIDGEDLDRMMNDEFFGTEFKDKKIEYDAANDSFHELKTEKERIEDEIEFTVRKDLGWSERAYKSITENKPEEVYANTEKYDFKKVLNYYEPLLKEINGKIKDLDGTSFEIKLPHGKSTFLLNKNTAALSLKQKREYTNPYNYHYRRLKEFIMTEHFGRINQVVEKKIEGELRNNPKMIQIKNDISAAEKTIKTLSDDINNIKQNGATSTMNEVIAEIIKKPGGTYRGFYAAIKGYDAIINKSTWAGDTPFAVILNRSKMIVRDFRE